LFVEVKSRNMYINLNSVAYLFLSEGGGSRADYSVTVVFTTGHSLELGHFKTKKEAEGFIKAFIKQSESHK